MAGWTRAPLLLLSLAAAGFLLWLAAQFDLHTTGGYWAGIAIVAGSGLVVGLAHLRGGGGHPPTMLSLAFLPLLVCAGWVIVAAQPHAGWGRGQVLAWSRDLGIRDVVDSVATWTDVLAFAVGLVLASVLEPRTIRARRTAVVAAEPPVPISRKPLLDYAAADEPVAAEREVR